MMTVIRRILMLTVIAAAVLVLASCAAAAPNALSVGSHSISRDGLNDLVLAVNGEDPESEDLPNALNIDAVRQVGAAWIQIFARADYLESTGVVFDSAAEEEAKPTIEAAISAGQLPPIDQGSDAYETLLINGWISTYVEELNEAEALEAIQDLLADADVDSRLGAWSPSTGLIGPA